MRSPGRPAGVPFPLRAQGHWVPWEADSGRRLVSKGFTGDQHVRGGEKETEAYKGFIHTMDSGTGRAP